jgi:putative transposase
MDVGLCLEALNQAFESTGTVPEIFNTDQGCQFTSAEWIEALESRGIQISMDGKGCWRDNVFVERLWRTIKYEEVYLRAYASVSEARASLGRYIDGFYNTVRRHSALDFTSPAQFESVAAT